MKANDLRIGNIIKVPNHTAIVTDILQNINGGHIRFRPLGSEEKKTFGYYLEVCEPIPVTEEWILKFGFEKDETKKVNDIYLKDWGDFYFIVNVNNNSFHLRVSNHSFYHQSLTGLGMIHSVHQLQNLYHALTGEELTLKN